MKHLFVLFVFLLSFHYGFCQTDALKKGDTVAGRLTDEKSEPKANVLVLLSNFKNKVQRSQFTDSLGKFTFQSIGAGEYYIGTTNGKNEIVKLKTIRVSDTVRTINIGDIILTTEVHQLQEVVIKEDRPYIQRKLDKLIINVDANTMLAGNTLTELLPKLPGISLNENNQIVVNGKSGVLILIDGKGQYVSQDQLSVLLNNMKAESIDKIEIISNPSVKYDANGGAVINIVTKKNSMTSDVHQTFGQQISPIANVSGKNEPNYSIGTNLNYLFGKVRTFASIDYSYDKAFQENDNSLQYVSPVFNRNALSNASSISSRLNTRFGFNADLSKTTSLDGTFSLNIPFYRYLQKQANQIFTSKNAAPDSVINSAGNDRYYHNRNSTINLRLNKILNESKNEEIAFYFDFNDFNYLDNNVLNNNYFILNSNYRNELYNSEHSYFVRIYSFKTDYSIKVGSKSRLEAGGKISFIHNVENYNYSFIQNSTDLLDSTKFNYTEIVSAGYLNYVGSNSLFDYQFGVRVENTASDGYAPLLNEQISRQYLDFFPAFTLQHNFKSKIRQQLTLSYNKRIIRPGYGDFNPNTNLTGRFYSVTGDPSLDPQFINNFELSYNLASLNVTLFDAYENNIKGLITLPSNQGLIQDNQIVSYKSSNDVGINISYPYSINKWWTTYSSFNGAFTNTYLLDNSSLKYFSYQFSESETFALNSKNKIDLRFFYRPETQFNYGKMLQVDNLSAGYRVMFLQNKLAMTFNVNDILGHNKLSTIQNFGDVSTESISLKNNRSYALTLRYNFASGKNFSLRNNGTKNDKSEIRLN